MIKYKSIYFLNAFQNFTIDERLQSVFSLSARTINSNWGVINNSTNYDSTVKANFLYYLFEPTIIPQNHSICIMNEPIFKTYTTDTFYKFDNKTYSNDVYDNIVVAYFLNYDGEEFYISYKDKKIYITSGGLWIWISVVFCSFLLFVTVGTYLLYRKIKRKENEDNNEQFIEINQASKLVI